MATPVIMPRQGQSVESCIITKWHKNEGDTVNEGDLLFTYETDKATFDEEAKVSGNLLKIFFPEGEDVPCLLNVCVVGNPGEDVSAFAPDQGAQEAAPAAPAEAEAKQEVAPAAAAPVPAAAATAAPGGEVKVSPRARNTAARLGLDPSFATATGPEGRIIERDIMTLKDNGPLATRAALAGIAGMENLPAGTGLGGRITTGDLAAAAAAPVAAAAATAAPEVEVEEVKLTNMRKVIAKSMMASLSGSAQLTLNTSFDCSDINAFRKKLKANGEKLGMPKITINDIILYVVSRTLKDHAACNAHILDDKMLFFKHAHLGIAVDTERGLMVPTLFNADRKSLAEVSREAKALASDCQKGSIAPDLLKGASFTVSNLGTMGVESFTPVINPPQTCILGVCTITERVRTVDGVVTTYPAMGLSLTFDHRALDGADAGRFLKDLATRLENFSLVLAQ